MTSFIVQAQDSDSTITSRYFPDTWNKAQIDTSILDIHNYHPSQYFGIPGTGTGNIGSAVQSLSSTPTKYTRKEFGILTNYSHLLDKAFSLNKFDTSSRFTRLYYQIGSGKQQNLKVDHSQFIKPNIQAAITFNRISSEGKYSRQLNRVADLGAGIRGSSNSGRYRFFGNYRLQHLENQENGGATPSAAPLGDPQLQAVFLSSANNDIRNYSLFFHQELHLGSKISQDTITHIYPLKLFTQHSYSRGRALYSDDQPLSGFYNYAWLDTTQTRDVLRMHDFINEAGFAYSLSLNEKIYKIGASFLIRNDKQIFEGVDTSFNDLGWKINAGIIHSGKIDFDLTGYGILAGQAAGDLDLRLNSIYSISDKLKAFLKIRSFDLQPALVLQKYTSNHHIWKSDLPSVKSTEINVGSEHTPFGFKANLNYQMVKNYLYLNSDARPASLSENISITSIQASKSFKPGKWIFKTEGKFNIVSNENAVSLPDFLIHQRIQYYNLIFKNALRFSAGVDLSYLPEYFGDAWMPATRMFFHQTTKMTGGNLFVSPFVNLGIKRARIFVVLEDALGNESMIVPNYPMPGRSLRFGINWDFYD